MTEKGRSNPYGFRGSGPGGPNPTYVHQNGPVLNSPPSGSQKKPTGGLWLDDGDVRLYHGDNLDVLRALPDRSVHMCATSPPFYGLRDYGTGLWEGGDPDCDHTPPKQPGRTFVDGHGGEYATNNQNWSKRDPSTFHQTCGKCGARRVDQQIGLEDTPDQWVERLVQVFREVRRVLRDDGTLWVEIGDSYATAGGGTGGPGKSEKRWGYVGRTTMPDYKQKDLIGQPWLLAFALRADGWYLRSEIIWARPNPMPESVTDRPTKSHSTVFLLSKQPRYFYDADAIREEFQSRPQQRLTKNVDMPLGAARVAAGVQQGNPQGGTHINRFKVQAETLAGDCGCHDAGCGRTFHADDCGCSCHDGIVVGPDGRRVTAVKGQENSEQHRDGERWPNPSGANARSVWQIPTQPTPFAHFATWPEALVRRMILAGTSEKGCCPVCGAPWVRDVERELAETNRTSPPNKGHVGNYTGERAAALTAGGWVPNRDLTVRTLGWSPSCAHDHQPGPCTVLDPFAGSATTMLVARNHGRHSVGIELNEDYLQIAAKRLQQLSLLSGS